MSLTSLVNDPTWALCTFIQSNLSCGNPTTANLSGMIFTAGTDRDFVAPSIVIGPKPEATASFAAAREIKYVVPVPVTVYTVFNTDPTSNTSGSPQTAKIQRWNMLQSVRSLIQNNSMLSRDGTIQKVWNGGMKEVNLTKWRPNVLCGVTTVYMRWLDDIPQT